MKIETRYMRDFAFEETAKIKNFLHLGAIAVGCVSVSGLLCNTVAFFVSRNGSGAAQTAVQLSFTSCVILLCLLAAAAACMLLSKKIQAAIDESWEQICDTAKQQSATLNGIEAREWLADDQHRGEHGGYVISCTGDDGKTHIVAAAGEHIRGIKEGDQIILIQINHRWFYYGYNKVTQAETA